MVIRKSGTLFETFCETYFYTQWPRTKGFFGEISIKPETKNEWCAGHAAMQRVVAYPNPVPILPLNIPRMRR
jgi:hypothetical protein